MKAILVIEFDDKWLDRTNTTYDKMFADVTIYKKESLEKQCDYSQRLYRCWCPLKQFPEKKKTDVFSYSGLPEQYRKEGWNECLDTILECNDK